MAQVTLWCTFYEDIENEGLLGEYQSLLNERERSQQQRFSAANDSKRYLVTRALLRTVLSRHFLNAIPPAQWVFITGQYGKPEIANPWAKRFSFNISHTKGLIILGVANSCSLGIDVEQITDRQGLIGIAEQFFASVEVQALMALPKRRRQQRFFEYWTLKESYIKARGAGLSIPLDQVSFQFTRDESIPASINPVQLEIAKRWNFWQFRIRDSYVGAVCAPRADCEPLSVLIYNAVPMISENPIPYRLSGISPS